MARRSIAFRPIGETRRSGMGTWYPISRCQPHSGEPFSLDHFLNIARSYLSSKWVKSSKLASFGREGKYDRFLLDRRNNDATARVTCAVISTFGVKNSQYWRRNVVVVKTSFRIWKPIVGSQNSSDGCSTMGAPPV